MQINQLQSTKQTLLRTIKSRGSMTIANLAECLDMTRESIRQHLIQLEHDGYVHKQIKRSYFKRGGRPSKYYQLTEAAEHLFPKNYDVLATEVIDRVAGEIGPSGLEKILASMTDARVKEWEPKLEGLSLEERLQALKGFYLRDDEFMQVETDGDELRLIEGNCPFLNVATKRPAVCSVTVSTLSRLLGYHVIREEKFQNGDGRCVFKVQLDKPINKDYSFKLEEET